MKSRLILVCAVLILALCGMFTGEFTWGRIWSDRTGKFSVEAEFVALNGDNIILRREDGKEVTIPLSKLSEDDIAVARALAAKVATPSDKTDSRPKPPNKDPLEDNGRVNGNRSGTDTPSGNSAQGYETDVLLPPDVTTAPALRKLLAKETEGKRGFKLCKQFTANSKISDLEKGAVQEEMAVWSSRSDADQLRLGRNWVSRDERYRIQAQTDELLLQGMRLLSTKAVESLKDKMALASRTNPEDFRADFIMGIYNALALREPEDSEKNFEESVKRLSPERRYLGPLDQANYGAALNNLALSELRNKKFVEATRHFEEAAQVAPHSKELVQNLGRFIYLIEKHEGKANTTYRNRVADIYGKLAASMKGEVFQENIGWLFISFVSPKATDSSQNGDEDQKRKSSKSGSIPDVAGMRMVGSGTGFVVADDFIMTNRHVAEDADAYLIFLGKGSAKHATAKHIAPKKGPDLALLHCPGLGRPVLSLATEDARRSSEIMILGYPKPSMLGVGLKSTRGIVTAVPEKSVFGGMMQLDAIANPGNSGGPVCDRHGNICGVLTAITAASSLPGGQLSLAIPASTARQFLEGKLPTLQNPRPAATPLEWVELDDLASPSTVLIFAMQSTANLAVEDADEQEEAPSSKGPNTQRRKRISPYEDFYCVACYGKQKLRCPGGCVKGVKTIQVRQQIGRNPVTGAAITGLASKKMPCDTCGGQGFRQCTNCIFGIDKDLLGRGSGR